MSIPMVELQNATIRQHCKALRMPTIGSQFGTLAEQAVREKTTHLAYLEALLTVEMESVKRTRLIDGPRKRDYRE